MKEVIFSVTAIAIMIMTGCRSSKQVIVPLNQSIELDDTYTIIWNGISEAYRYENGQWLRAESYDYQFDVVQKRYDKHWKSVKSLHRIHPDYDGKAGDRDQTMYFEVDYKNLVDQKVEAVINSSLGNGTGTTDNEFRQSVLTMYVPNASKFMPYNKFRITQHYNYEEGLLTETVELIKEKDGKDIPFMKNQETALIFIKSKLERAPTTYKQ
ncbi:MAG: hypothetical protein KDC85_09860 [Saprospiraceae bacterium]|nr:hypothetical protein [Saprospiraceae bacterium]MCB9323310.1 hypothetical protein [Lewinellaceae bacterium]